MLTHRFVRVAACGALLLALPAVAEAQLGGLVRKAAEKAIEKKTSQPGERTTDPGGRRRAASSASCRQVTFDATTVELTPQRVDGIVKALQAARATPNGQKRDALVARRAAAEARLQELENDESIRGAEHSHEEWESCRGGAFGEIQQRKMQQAGNEALAVKYMQVMREHQEKISAAMVAGDSVRAKALQDSTILIYSRVIPITGADSQAVARKCGKPPRIPQAKIDERDSLRTAVRELGDEIRELDDADEAAVRKASGMTAAQFAMARERLTMFVKGGVTCGFTQGEADAITAKKAELDQLL